MDDAGDAGADHGLCGRAPGVVGSSMQTDFSPLYLLRSSVKDHLAVFTPVCFGPPVVCVYLFPNSAVLGYEKT